MNGHTLTEMGLLLRGVVEKSELKIGEIARHLRQATFGGEDIRNLGAQLRPDVFPLPVPSSGPEEARLITVLQSGDVTIGEVRRSFANTIARAGHRAWVFLVIVALNYLWVGNSAASGLS